MATDGLTAAVTRALALLDLLAYVASVAALSTLAAIVVGVATGGGLVRAKVLLFLFGVALMVYSTVRLWPSRPGDGREGSTADSVPTAAGRTRFQRFVGALPPMRWIESPPPHERVTAPGKLFWGSVATLLVSYLMEAAFGIA